MLREQEATAEREEIALYIRYGVVEDELPQALEMLERYGSDFFGLTLLRFYYTGLPDPHGEALRRIVLITHREDLFLFALSSSNYTYLCLVDSQQQAVWLGEFSSGVVDPELLDFFGFKDVEAFRAFCPDLSICPDYQPISSAASEYCPSCFVKAGEVHHFGCPVEICPWCDAQLSHCACRFEHLGVEALDDEEQLEQLEQLLNAKGRIPFAREHAPSFPAAGSDDSEPAD